MEELETKRNTVIKALTTYKEALDIMENPKYQEISNTIRDSVIQRFEYTLDIFWKFLKYYMQKKLSIVLEFNNPKAILKEAFNNKLIDENEFYHLIDGLADRNLTSHSYKEEVAHELAKHLPLYYEIMNNIIHRTIEHI